MSTEKHIGSKAYAKLANAVFGSLKNKVDKIDGKGLSTNDFTTDLKNKLSALPTKATLDTSLAAKAAKADLDNLRTSFNTLVGDGDATAVIDTFNEIEAFLAGVTNMKTLTGLLAEQKTTIETAATNKYLPKSSYTAADVLSKLKSVDGAGSGLDADLLGGKSEENLEVASAAMLKLVPANGDLNIIKRSEFAVFTPIAGRVYTNLPEYVSGEAFLLMAFPIGPKGFGQIVVGDFEMFYRICDPITGSWTDWMKFMTDNSVEQMMTQSLMTEAEAQAIIDAAIS